MYASRERMMGGRAMTSEVSERKLRRKPRYGWMNLVKSALNNRGLGLRKEAR